MTFPDDPRQQAYSSTPPTEQFAPPSQPFTTAYPPPGPNRGPNTAIVMLLTLLIVAVVAALVVTLWLLVFRNGQDEAAAPVTTSTVTAAATPRQTLVPTAQGEAPPAAIPAPAPVAQLPSDSIRCASVYGNLNGYKASATGSAVTSCPFAEEVRLAYAQSGPRGYSRLITAVSPVTGTAYDMNCVANATVVTCAGGDNAVVYLY